MWAWIIAGVATLVSVAFAVALVAARARARALAHEVQTAIEPYLRRKVAEGGAPVANPTWTARTPPETVVRFSATLARQLLEIDRSGVRPTATRELALASTQRIDEAEGA